MTSELAISGAPVGDDCWNRIGVRGDGSCPELVQVIHCHNCPVFSRAGRRFLNAPAPEGYLDEWGTRLAAPAEQAATDLESVLVFRIGEEWLALPVAALVEVTGTRPVHRVPHRGGLLQGIVNIRGELHLCVRIAELLGIRPVAEGDPAGGRPQVRPEDAAPAATRLLVTRREGETWAFPVDEVDRVRRIAACEIAETPATVSRAVLKMTRGVFAAKERTVGLIDEARLFHALRARIR